jgi:zinc transport system substrate-binding protein
MPQLIYKNCCKYAAFSLVATIVFYLCTVPAYAVTGNRLVIYTVNYPLAYLAERIGGDQVDTRFPAPGDIDPAFWVPDTETILAYQQADLVLLNGAGYAKWLNRVSLPKRKLVNTTAKTGNEYIRQDDGISHSHGPSGDHSHGDYAFTTWLDFQLAIEQARSIAKALSGKRPEHAQTFADNLAGLEANLAELDQRLKNVAEGLTTAPLLASHPVYQYLARRYQLNLKSMHWEPDQYPPAEQWQALEKILIAHPAKLMLWEAEPATNTVETLGSLGIKSIVFDPAGNRPADGDFLTVMQQNMNNLEKVFR